MLLEYIQRYTDVFYLKNKNILISILESLIIVKIRHQKTQTQTCSFKGGLKKVIANASISVLS